MLSNPEVSLKKGGKRKKWNRAFLASWLKKQKPLQIFM